jgi:phosphoribosylformylglycinamidine cyclo-ligase
VLPDSLAAQIDLGAIALPPVFAWLQREGAIDSDEMLRTFNCGVGMVLVTAPKDVERVLVQLGGDATIIGALTPRGDGAPVRYQGKLTTKVRS